MLFLRLPDTIPVVKRAGGDIRLVLTTSCQKGCDFCHLEGHKSPEEIGCLNQALAGWKTRRGLPMIERLGGAIREDDVQATIVIAHALGLSNVHLTGGEPSLHPQLLSIVARLHAAGLTVGMTTHAELNQSFFEALLHSGLNSLNVSLHAISAEQYVAMDLLAQDIARRHGTEAALRYADQHLANKKRNIARALAFTQEQPGFRVKANSVVQDSQTAIAIVEWCNQVGCPIRLQRNIKNTEQCRERFYGLRIERGWVTTCIDVSLVGVTRFDLQDFVSQLKERRGIPFAILQTYEQIARIAV
jgi:cyclic pyranopterin phosphate synthase